MAYVVFHTHNQKDQQSNLTNLPFKSVLEISTD